VLRSVVHTCRTNASQPFHDFCLQTNTTIEPEPKIELAEKLCSENHHQAWRVEISIESKKRRAGHRPLLASIPWASWFQLKSVFRWANARIEHNRAKHFVLPSIISNADSENRHSLGLFGFAFLELAFLRSEIF
jgi:hypothetical protein